MTLHRALILGLAACATLTCGGALAGTPLTACDVKLNVADPDPAGLNVRATPGGAVIAALKAKGRWVQTHVTGQSGTWAAIDAATYMLDDGDETPLFAGHGFVAFSKLAIDELDQRSRILAAPKDDAKLLLLISESDETLLPKAEVLGCEGRYLKVRVKGLVGWTRDFCSNEFTTCV
jgi:uncharacterized protein YbjT (DUF2867 family)